ncbi:MAG: hypothetical protein RIC19_16535 [Phaeodactylibacter sp.]|uniref:DinB family protein n=1 Tax=Phaeodactylibacter sp. TaxID=1940289 RepID=UPI0032EF0459
MQPFYLLSFLLLFLSTTAQTQTIMPKDTLPYQQIPEAPETYTSSATVARMIDGLGFRYYWATEGLTPADLKYKPSEEGRTILETLTHIHGLASMVYNSAFQQPNKRPATPAPEDFETLRRTTLLKLKAASDQFRAANTNEMATFDLIFERDGVQSTVPFWHQLNGPIADALWHVGQVVAFRRAAGNPVFPGINWFQGKAMDK